MLFLALVDRSASFTCEDRECRSTFKRVISAPSLELVTSHGSFARQRTICSVCSGREVSPAELQEVSNYFGSGFHLCPQQIAAVVESIRLSWLLGCFVPLIQTKNECEKRTKWTRR